jgi:hypothetical protein
MDVGAALGAHQPIRHFDPIRAVCVEEERMRHRHAQLRNVAVRRSREADTRADPWGP